MGKPVVLAAFDPLEPEEAIAVQKELAEIATVRWHQELGSIEAPGRLADVDAVLLMGWPKWLDPILPTMDRLRFIQRAPAGVEAVPFDLLSKLKVRPQVASGSGSNAAWVAEHAMGLILACAKKVAFHDREMRKGAFHQGRPASKELAGSTLGILGYGSIGQRVGELARAFGIKVQAIRREKAPPGDRTILGGLEALDQLLASSDFVLVSLPLSTETRGLIDKAKLQLMKNGAVLVNVARGPIVDEEALYHHLSLHPDFFAGLDVWWKATKPGVRFEPRFPFQELPNVVMTPHNASIVPGYRTRMAAFGAKNIRTFLEGKTPLNLAKYEDYLGQPKAESDWHAQGQEPTVDGPAKAAGKKR